MRGFNTTVARGQSVLSDTYQQSVFDGLPYARRKMAQRRANRQAIRGTLGYCALFIAILFAVAVASQILPGVDPSAGDAKLVATGE